MSDNDPGRDDLAGEKAAHTTPADSPTDPPTPESPAADDSAPSVQGDDAASEGTAASAKGAADLESGSPRRSGGAAVAPQRSGEVGRVSPSGQDAPDGGAETAQQSVDDAAQALQGSGGTGSGDSPDSDGEGVEEEGGDEASGPRSGDEAASSADSSGRGAAGGGTGGAGEGARGSVNAVRAGDAGGGVEAEDGGGVEAEDGGGVEAEDGGKRPRRSRRRRVLRRTALGLVVVMLLGGAGGVWLYRDLMGGIEQKDVSDQLGDDRPEKLNKSLNILLLGSDSREGDNAEYATAGMSGARSDTAILLHLSPNRDQAVGISFPRDSMVKIPACKKEKDGTVPARFGMLNSAFAFAGPTCTWKTLESLTGIHIDHFVQIDFSGFKRMVDALGGVEICVDKPVNDPRAELYLKAGKQTVKGDKALGYVRARYSLGNGSDLERIERQQKFMAAVVDKATDSVLRDPAKTYKFLKAATKSITTDDELDLSAMRKLADGLRGMSAGQVRFVTVPVERYAPDPNRVQWNQELAKPLFEAIRHDNDLPAEPVKPVQAKQAPPAPGEVNVTVVAAGGKDALVKRVVKQLGRRGYKVAKKVEKAAAVPESRIVYAAPAEAQASTLARDVPDALLTADATAPAGGVRLVIGEKGLRLSPPPIGKIGGGVKAGEDLCA